MFKIFFKCFKKCFLVQKKEDLAFFRKKIKKDEKKFLTNKSKNEQIKSG